MRSNLVALAQGDAKTFCGSYTPQFLRTYRDSYAACVDDFEDPPNPRARVPRIVWTDFLTSGDPDKVAVEFTVDGGRSQTYYLERRRPVPQVGSTPRWLIDMETVQRE